jgi:polysaccharide pyruvyl transferase WcaK-like protein
MQRLVTHYMESTSYKIVVFCTEIKDTTSLQKLKEKLFMYKDNSRLIYKKITTLNEVLDVYEKIDLLFGTRMHSTILAFSQGIPFVGIDWQQKVNGFFRTVDSGQNLLNVKEFINDQNNAINKIDKLIDDYIHESNRLLSKKEKLIPMYEINKTILEKFF